MNSSIMSVTRSVAIAAALITAPAAVVAQRAAVQGIVTSSETGQPLEGVAVILEAAGRQTHAAFTDRNGFYQIGAIVPGTYTLKGQMLGYADYTKSITLAADERLVENFRVAPAAVVLRGIVVETEQGAAIRDLGRQRVTPADISRVPTPAGSGDLASYLQTLPGVTTTGDRGGQVFVRGGTPAENLALVDGIPIYQPFHILGFFSVFPEDLVSSVDFYAGGFGARYQGRTSSVLDVRIRDGDANNHHAMVSVSPFLAEAIVEGPWQGGGVKWIASFRRSMLEETSGTLLGRTQPLSFESQLFKVTSVNQANNHCGAIALRTSDKGRIDPDERQSHVAWTNLLGGFRCLTMRGAHLLEVNFNFSTATSSAVSRGSSDLHSRVWRAQHDVNATTMVGSTPLHAGYYTYLENMDYDLAELFGTTQKADEVFGVGGHVEATLPVGTNFQARPGIVATLSPRLGLEPRLRASWQPFGRSSEIVQGAIGLYKQNAIGTSDSRDVSSVFTAWMAAPDGAPLQALHSSLGWQQTIGGFQLSLEGYYKQLKDVPVPVWRGVAQFNTQLGRADGEVYGADTRLEYSRENFYGYIGYGYSNTRYSTSQWEFATWFGESVQSYHPPHDRRHQLNALASIDIAGFKTSARWQLGTGLPFTRPMGFDEAFDYSLRLHDVRGTPGVTRLILDKPYTGRLPMTHRLDLSVERDFDLSLGRLVLQAGIINAYDRSNMFYYDLYTARRVDQLPIAPYFSATLRGR